MKKFKFNKKDIIATDCKIVSEDENGIIYQMKINNNEYQKLLEQENKKERNFKAIIYLLSIIIAIGIIILLIYQQFS